MKQQFVFPIILLLLAFQFVFFLGNQDKLDLEPLAGEEVVDAGDEDEPVDAGTGDPTVEGTFTVRRVVDGDTIIISTGQRVRYIGINSPETSDPREDVACFGKEARTENKKLVEGKKVRLEKDVSTTDSFGRLLRYVYLKNGKKEVLVNEKLVREGYARASSFPPDLKYQEKLEFAQKFALARQDGLWAYCL
jgi:micrococcal nuclease